MLAKFVYLYVCLSVCLSLCLSVFSVRMGFMPDESTYISEYFGLPFVEQLIRSSI